MRLFFSLFPPITMILLIYFYFCFSKVFSKIYPLARKARTSSFPPRDCSLPQFCHGRNTVISFVTKLICYFDIKFSSFICNNSSTESIILISWETIKYQCLAILRSFYLTINDSDHTIAIFGNFWIVSYVYSFFFISSVTFLISPSVIRYTVSAIGRRLSSCVTITIVCSNS